MGRETTSVSMLRSLTIECVQVVGRKELLVCWPLLTTFIKIARVVGRKKKGVCESPKSQLDVANIVYVYIFVFTSLS